MSYVLPVYNEVAGIEAFHAALVAATEALRDRFDVDYWYVDDGSTDGSDQVLARLADADPIVRVVTFARNFGHQVAITAGIDHAEGDAVVIMDTDGQDPPAVSVQLVDRWAQGDVQIVHAQRATRQDGRFKKATAHLYYRLLARLSDVEIPVDTGDFRLLDRAAVQELRRFRERNRFVRGLVASLGFRQAFVQFHRHDRAAGETKYSLAKMTRLAVDGVTTFSTQPLQLVFRVGVGVMGLSILGMLYALGMRLFAPGITVSGWTLLIMTMLFLGGVQMICIGLIGLYVGRIFTEVQERPLYIIEGVRNDPAEHQAWPALDETLGVRAVRAHRRERRHA